MRKRSLILCLSAALFLSSMYSVWGAAEPPERTVFTGQAEKEGFPYIQEEMKEEGISVRRDARSYYVSVTGTMIRSEIQEFVHLLNQERAKLGRPEVKLDEEMMKIAERRAGEGSFLYGHIRPDGSSGFQWAEEAQRISWEDCSAKELLKRWKESAPHWQGLTDPQLTRIGLGLYKQENTEDVSAYACLWTDGTGPHIPYSGTFQDTTETYRFSASSGYIDFNTDDSYSLETGKSIEVKAFYTTMRHTPVLRVTGTIDDVCGTWRSDNPAIASVSDDGIVSAHRPGTTQVHFYLNDDREKTYTAEVTVSGERLPVTIKGNFIYRGSEKLYGWVQDGEETYYTDPSTGEIKTGFVEVDGKNYFFVPVFMGEYVLGGTDRIFGVCEMLKDVELTINGQWYHFNGDGTWQYISEVPVQTPVPEGKTPAAPFFRAEIKGYQAVQFSWNQPEGADGYQIYRYNTKNKRYERYKTVLQGKTLTYKKKLGYGKEERFKIRAYILEADGKTRIYGPFSKAVIVQTAPEIPELKAMVKKGGNVRLSWNYPQGADGYQIFRYNRKSKKYERYKTIPKGAVLSYTKKLGYNKSESFKIRAYALRPDGKTRIYGPFSKIVKVDTAYK